jgi:hypothetical protein
LILDMLHDRERRKCGRINGELGENRTHDQQTMISVNRVVDVAKSFEIMVSRVGIEPTTRRLRVLSRTSKPSKN